MARVRATCDQCGDIELTIDEVGVRICREDHDGVYTFTCPKCRRAHEKQASRRTLDLLVASGADVVFWSIPVENLVEHDLGPLTHDDLLDFHEQLQDDSLIESAFGSLVDER